MPKRPNLSRKPPPSSQADLDRMIWPEPTPFMLSHCDHCALSLNFKLPSGVTARSCTLDDEPLLEGLTYCDRYIPKLPASRPRKS